MNQGVGRGRGWVPKQSTAPVAEDGSPPLVGSVAMRTFWNIASCSTKMIWLPSGVHVGCSA